MSKPAETLLFGSHLSIAGGLYKAVDAATGLGMRAVQIFTKNQKTWAAPPLTTAAIDGWRTACDNAGFTQTVSHASYLINLASPDPAQRKKSVDLFVDEIRRCDALGVPWLVAHPGAHMGEGETAGIERIAKGLDTIFGRTKKSQTIVCLESTAGQGSSVGHKLEHLAEIIASSKHPERLAVCLDTAHLFAAGYDFRGRKYAGFVKELDATVGVDHVKVWHINDSKKELGSRVDRHEHIGRGTIGDDGFRPLVRDKRWKNIPMILETPKGEDDEGTAWDAINMQRLRDLTTGPSSA